MGPLDNQVIELPGRNRLIDELLRAGLEVAQPLRDCGVDLIVYSGPLVPFVARPIQMKAASRTSFSLDRKYAKFPGLILAYVWHLAEEKKTETYALTYGEALQVAKRMKWTDTNSWTQKGNYTNNQPGIRLLRLLKPYKIDSPEKWRTKITERME